MSVINFLLLVSVLAQMRTTAQQDISPLIRSRAIEPVCDNGKVRAQLNVEKTGEDGSGLVLKDDRTEATVQIRANKNGGGITLFDRDSSICSNSIL